jgi:hypothetical protein
MMNIKRSTRLKIYTIIFFLALLGIIIFVPDIVSYIRQMPQSKQLSANIKNQPRSGENTGFVTRSGTLLTLNGQPFRFGGANIHWLALDDSKGSPSQFRVDDALNAAKEMGLTVIRSHSLGISTGCSNCIEPSLNVFNESALQRDDYVITAAAARGLRLIIPLTDNWRYPAGGKHTFTDWRGISDENQFYYNPQVINDFETYISTLLNRVNVYTGVAYKNDPTILGWETGNELQPPESWTQTISTFIKGIDNNHLVIDGQDGVDPNAASLPNIDILSDHYYPKSIVRMNADASTAAKTGKAFIIGEFDWNDANGGDPLDKFLASVQANPNVSGDAFWELWSHDDQYGYDRGDQYTLHYPGDTATMLGSVSLLRQYAYPMNKQQVPPNSVPGTPLIEKVIINGTSNTLIWQGTTFAASYTIERSTNGPAGPWTTVCNRCVTDNNAPWIDTTENAGPLWYHLIAYNLNGVAGPPTQAYQARSNGIMIDNLNDWSHVYQHSKNLAFDTTNSQYMLGDTSRVVRLTATHEFIIWKQTNMVSFQAVSYFWPREPVSSFSFYTSVDGTHWTAITPQVVSLQINWQEYIYTLQGLSGVNNVKSHILMAHLGGDTNTSQGSSGVNYVKVVWNNITGQYWNPNLGTVTILY